MSVKYDWIRKYRMLRIKYSPAFFMLWTAVAVLAISLKRQVIYLIPVVVLVLSVLETLIIKCDSCQKRPVSFLKSFPKKCPQCGSDMAGPE